MDVGNWGSHPKSKKKRENEVRDVYLLN